MSSTIYGVYTVNLRIETADIPQDLEVIEKISNTLYMDLDLEERIQKFVQTLVDTRELTEVLKVDVEAAKLPGHVV